ncbi:hypothetical protein KUW19_00085 [Ferrimonas balearica]|uniref:hypothetical protein n=1 Tax=Ferrimonas balearica TaxID=44012 RepID=UPI001C986FEB|nr:hypothetical protein [Ferrimonas balearica]MBY6104879.1 hypothetical protein [Ferrimonas balearica]
MERTTCPNPKCQRTSWAYQRQDGRWRNECNHCGQVITASRRDLLPARIEAPVKLQRRIDGARKVA